MEELNRSLFVAINAGAAPDASSLWLATIIAQWLIYGVPLLLMAMWLWGGRQARAAALTSSTTLVVALLCNVLIAIFWFHPRPFMIPLGHQYLAHAAETSFPSDHAVTFFAVGLGMLFSDMRRTGVTLVLLGIAVGGARVYLGVHFPFDIIGALLVSVAVGWAVSTIMAAGATCQRCLNILEAVYRRLFRRPINRGWVQP